METATVPQQHTMCLSIAFAFRVVLTLVNLQCANSVCFWSGMLREWMWPTTSQKMTSLESHVPYGLPEEQLVKASLL